MFKSKKETLAGITKRVRNVDGKEYVSYDAYFGYDPLTGKPKRMFDSDRKRLETRIADYYASLKTESVALALLTHAQVFDAKAAYAVLNEFGIAMPLVDVVKAYVRGEVMKREEEKENESGKAKELSAAYMEYIATFDAIQDRQIMSIKTRVGPFVATRPGVLVKDVTSDMILSYLDSNVTWKNKTWNNAMTYIKSFMNWCASPIRGYAASNPAEAIKRKRIEWKEPEYMRVDAVASIIRIVEAEKDTHPDYLAFFVLSFFCGMRTAEIERMAADSTAVIVTVEDETIRVAKPKGYQKGIRPRSFQIPDTALAWIKSFDFFYGVGRIDTKTRRYIGLLAKKHGIEISGNAGRHSFITYHVAAYGEPSKTEGIVGTSASRRCENYMGLASRKDGLAYFAIRPTSSAQTV